VLRSSFVAICLISVIGCMDPKTEASAGPSGSPAVSIPTTPESHPADAVETAKSIQFPLLDDPAKPALAMVSDEKNGEKHFEVDQVVKRSVAEATTFYEKALGMTSQKDAKGVSIQGETSDGKFVIMTLQEVDGKTAVGAKVLTYAKESKP
jgi:hypothetical protein